MPYTILSYRQIDSVKLLCEIDLKKLFPAPKERNRFDKNRKLLGARALRRLEADKKVRSKLLYEKG